MPIVSGTITQHGAVVDVHVGVSQRRQAVLERNALPVPPRIYVRALIDTGSAVTAFRSTVFQQLQLQPFTRIPIRTPSTAPGQPHFTDQYDVSLILASAGATKHFPSISAIVSDDFNPEDEDGLEALIGRDVLAHCVFQYFGHDQRFDLSF